VTPAGRVAAAIELLTAILGAGAPTHAPAPRPRPADAIANDWFRGRRFIGSSDRRAIAAQVWHVLRHLRRLGWWLDWAAPPAAAPPAAGSTATGSTATGSTATPRLLVAASLLLGGETPAALGALFSGAHFAPAPLDDAEQARLRRLAGHTPDHPGMPPAVRLELPDWLLPRLEARFGPALDAEMSAMLEPAPLDLRVNTLKTTRAEARAALAAEGLQAVPTRFSPWGLRIADRRQLTGGPAFQSGLVEIQDEGSQLIAALLDARPGQRVCDYCAGAGGKTLALAATMQNRGQIVACDTAAARLDNATRRLRRAGVGNVERHLLVPGDKWAKRRAAGFDRVLVDAPCTGTGTWRRNPDARHRLAESDLAELLARQAAILDAAAPLLRMHGRLVYATCALLEDENETQVKHFLDRHPGFALVPLPRAWPFEGPPPHAGDMLSLTPARHGTDGFFAAVLERTG
jgi:16S rRNA (cytosine967-C5)-methyltransferase